MIVDIEDYRKRREARLEDRARELAQRVAETGNEEELEPMNSYERKLVHDAAADVDGVETVSRGEEPGRYVVITPALTGSCPERALYDARMGPKACFT